VVRLASLLLAIELAILVVGTVVYAVVSTGEKDYYWTVFGGTGFSLFFAGGLWALQGDPVSRPRLRLVLLGPAATVQLDLLWEGARSFLGHPSVGPLLVVTVSAVICAGVGVVMVRGERGGLATD
jgi:hypothetical protein